MINALIYVVCGAFIASLFIYLYSTRKKTDTKKLPPVEIPNVAEVANTQKQSKPYESIRQTALVQVDEFEQFYIPFLERINWYEQLVELPRTDSEFHSLILKALRRRRAAIFEYDSPEADSNNSPYWTLGLFLSIGCRYAVQLLNSYEFIDSTGQSINPHLEKPSALQGLKKRKKDLSRQYMPDHVYHHIIEKLISPSIMLMLHDKKIYPFVVNAVIGHYQYRQMPFYRIIEEVEDHVYQSKQPLEQWRFEQTIKQILDMIENNTVAKNSTDALVFEASRYLYIDRHLLWELFKTYYVFDQALMSKQEFEERLINSLELYNTTTRHDTIKVFTDHPLGNNGGVSAAYIEIKNAFALPYSKIPLYSPTKRLRVEREILEREVILETDSDLFDMTQDVPAKSAQPKTDQEEPISALIKKVSAEPQRKAVFEETKND